MIFQLDRKVNVVISHGDRLICDDLVFQQKSDGRVVFLQNLPIEEDTVHGGLVFTDDVIITGHTKYGRVMLWKWDECENIYKVFL